MCSRICPAHFFPHYPWHSCPKIRHRSMVAIHHPSSLLAHSCIELNFSLCDIFPHSPHPAQRADCASSSWPDREQKPHTWPPLQLHCPQLHCLHLPYPLP